jgi:hypothetical protein
MQFASKLLSAQNSNRCKINFPSIINEITRPNWTCITRVVENSETVLFKVRRPMELPPNVYYFIWQEKFSDYPGMLPIAVTSQETRGNIAGILYSFIVVIACCSNYGTEGDRCRKIIQLRTTQEIAFLHNR